MHPAIKILIGFILLAIGLGLFVDSVVPIINPLLGGIVTVPTIDWLGNFMILVTGAIPPFLILLGLFIVWLEADELKMEREFRELEKEEEETEKEEEEQEKQEPEEEERKIKIRKKKK